MVSGARRLVAADFAPIQRLPTVLHQTIRAEVPMKVIVTGAAGLLGHDVWKAFEPKHEMHAMGRTQPPFVRTGQWHPCDLADTAQTYATVTRLNPDLVVHTAAYNNVDEAERRPEEAYRGN